jgi:hypothetical protein
MFSPFQIRNSWKGKLRIGAHSFARANSPTFLQVIMGIVSAFQESES